MSTYLIAFLATAFSMLAFDAVWLSTMAKRFYAPRLGTLMATSPKLLPAAIFYVIYAIGIVYFIVIPSVQNGSSVFETFLSSAALGFFAYATYDLTNHATLSGWPLSVTLVDLAWGTVLTGTVATIALSVVRLFS